MDLRLLPSFLAVVEEQHFGRAAARLFLSPAAVTQHIRRLENELGTPLLHRNPVRPTAAGVRLAEHARMLLAAADAAVEDVHEAVRRERETTARPLRVGIMGHGSAEITPAAVNAYRRARPEVPVEVIQLNFTEHVSALVEDRVDLAFIRPMPDDDRLVGDALLTEQRIVVVAGSAPLADARTEGVRVADLADLPIFRVPDHTPAIFKDYLYFHNEAARRGRSIALFPQEVLTGVLTGHGAGSGLHSFARYYNWPGAVFVPVLDAPPESSHLAARAHDSNPEVAIFRALATTLARELAPRINNMPLP